MDPFPCPHCQFILILPDHYSGRKTDCPQCKQDIQVPGSKTGRARKSESRKKSGERKPKPKPE